jgi:hypothetical protein
MRQRRYSQRSPAAASLDALLPLQPLQGLIDARAATLTGCVRWARVQGCGDGGGARSAARLRERDVGASGPNISMQHQRQMLPSLCTESSGDEPQP